MAPYFIPLPDHDLLKTCVAPLRKVNREKGTGICGGAGAARAPTYTPPRYSRVVFFSALMC